MHVSIAYFLYFRGLKRSNDKLMQKKTTKDDQKDIILYIRLVFSLLSSSLNHPL